jgi:hypothetical protein
MMRKALLAFFALSIIFSLSPLAVWAAGLYEAENAELKGVKVAKSKRASGGAYVTGLDAAGDEIVFHVSVPMEGTYPIQITYSASQEKYNDIAVNGDRVKSLYFPKTKGYQDIFACNARLSAGENTIAIANSWVGSMLTASRSEIPFIL